MSVRASANPPAAPPKVAGPTSVSVHSFSVGADTTLLHCSTAERPRMELEFSLGRGSSDNSYLVRGPVALALVDVPEAHFAAPFVAALGSKVPEFLVLTHFSPRYQEGEGAPSMRDIENEARAVYGGQLFLARDFDRYQLGRDGQLSLISGRSA